MAETTIGYAVLQIIPSLKGVSEAIEKQIAGQVVEVKIEPKTDAAKVDKSVKDAVKKSKPVEVQLEPKIDEGKLKDAGVKAGKRIGRGMKEGWETADVGGNMAGVGVEAGKRIGKGMKEGWETADVGGNMAGVFIASFEKADAAKRVGKTLRDAVTGGLQELNNNPALQDIQEQVGEQVGAAIGQKIGEALGNSWVGKTAQNIAETVQTVTGSLAAIKQGDAAGGLNGIADALGRIGQTGGATKLHEFATEVQPLQDKFGSLKTNIEGSTQGLLGLTNNSGKIAGGLTAIAGAAGPLAAAFVALDNLMPGFDQHLQNIMRTGGNFKDWVNTLLPQTNLLDQWAKNWINPGSTPAAPNSPIGPNGQARPGLTPAGQAPATVGGIPIPGLVPAGPGGGGSAPRPGGGSNGGTLGSSWLDGIIGPGTGDPVVPGRAAPSGFLGPGKAPEGGLQVKTLAASRAISAAFPEIQTIGGFRQDPLKWHPGGFAIDVMIPGGTTRGGVNPQGKALGDRIYAWVQANKGKLGVDYVLWQTDEGGDHYNHLHVNTVGGGYPKGGEQYQLPSLDTGTDGPLPDDVVAQLHKGEIVVPANQVKAAQNLLSNPFSFGLRGLGQGVGATKSGSDLSLFGNAAASAVSGQVSSALGAFGVPGAPRWLSGISQFIGGISVGGPAAIPTGAGQQQAAGGGATYNIKTATVEDAFVRAQRQERERAAAKLSRF